MRTDIKKITFREMVFEPIDDEIIYIESHRNKYTWLFDKYWQEIDKALMETCNMHFRYVPTLIDTIDNEQLKWHLPTIKENRFDEVRYLYKKLTTRDLFNYIQLDECDYTQNKLILDKGPYLPSGLIIHDAESYYQNDFLYCPLPIDDINAPDEIVALCVTCAKQLKNYYCDEIEEESEGVEVDIEDDEDTDNDIEDSNSGIIRDSSMNAIPRSMASIHRPYYNDADEVFDYQIEELLDEARTIIDRLRGAGVSEMVLNKLLALNRNLSPLVITTDYRIMLPDYDIEIEMRPLVKAVYFLFLRHPEGILFKSLPDYKQELASIYSCLRGGELSAKEQQSIQLVTNPLDNSINEKCARIRESFLIKISDQLTKNYMVSGERGEPKRITMSRDLVHWEIPFSDIPLTESKSINANTNICYAPIIEHKLY